MGQKVHPYGFQLGTLYGWKSNWFEERRYADQVQEDHQLRRHIKKKLFHAGISKVVIERTGDKCVVNIHTARPGILIGKRGAEVEGVRSFLCNLRSEHAIIFLKQVLKLVPGDIILIWDNHKIHISPQTQEFINDHPRIHEYRFPTCAPELNPVEFVWTQIGEHTASFAPHTIQELCARVQVGVARTRASKNRLSACLKTADLSWK